MMAHEHRFKYDCRDTARLLTFVTSAFWFRLQYNKRRAIASVVQLDQTKLSISQAHHTLERALSTSSLPAAISTMLVEPVQLS